MGCVIASKLQYETIQLSCATRHCTDVHQQTYLANEFAISKNAQHVNLLTRMKIVDSSDDLHHAGEHTDTKQHRRHYTNTQHAEK
jgi:hypothetical protein